MKTALLVIDVQNYFINEHTMHLPKGIKKFLEKKTFDLIIFTQFINHEGTNFVKSMDWRRCFTSPDIDIVPDLFPYAQIVFIKDTFSPFKKQEFADFIQKNRISTLYLCGTDTECCIYATAMDAFDCGLIVKVIPDLCGSHHGSEFHEQGLKLLANNLGKNILRWRDE